MESDGNITMRMPEASHDMIATALYSMSLVSNVINASLVAAYTCLHSLYLLLRSVCSSPCIYISTRGPSEKPMPQFSGPPIPVCVLIPLVIPSLL